MKRTVLIGVRRVFEGVGCIKEAKGLIAAALGFGAELRSIKATGKWKVGDLTIEAASEVGLGTSTVSAGKTRIRPTEGSVLSVIAAIEGEELAETKGSTMGAMTGGNMGITFDEEGDDADD